MGAVERQEIDVFLTLADELHFARTAQRLHLSAAAVSQTISRLERRFGAPLLTRTTRRVELTPLGQQLSMTCARPTRRSRPQSREQPPPDTGLQAS